MTSHLARLAARAAGQGASLRPRSLSQFEQPTSHPSLVEYVAPGDPASGPDFPAPPPAASIVVRSPVAGPERDHPRPPSTPLPQGAPVTPDLPIARRSPGEEAPPPTSPVRTPEPSLDEVPAIGPSAALPPAVGLPQVRPERSRTPTEADTVHRPTEAVLPSTRLPEARTRPGVHPSEAGEAVAVRRQDAPLPPTQRVADHGTTTPRELQPIEPQPAALPRLHPAPRSDHGQAPEVTVNIGRIEVLPPRAPEAKRPPATTAARRLTAGAPDLADYLRDRGRR